MHAPGSWTDRQSDETRAFFQARIASYLRIYGSIGGSFVLLRLILAATSSRGAGAELRHPSFLAHVLGVAFSFGGWAIARRGQAPVDTLERVETVALVASMTAYATMGLFLPLSAPRELVMLALSFGLFARAIYVPSTARRSLVLGLSIAIVHVATVAAAPYRPALDAREVQSNALFMEQIGLFMGGYPAKARVAAGQALNLALWWAGAIALTTGASRVIYALRAEVRDTKRLGQYQLADKLGEGGMGVVYRASHALLQRPAAVKLLPAERVGARTLARFEREVQLTARLTHPNTVTVFDYGRTPEGVFYYAMELLGGATLGEIVARHGPMPAARVVHVLRQVCASLAEAHGLGLIHRDIKPSNIVLCERGGVEDTVKVLDFGLVKELDRPETAQLTHADVLTGTPHYMPPEAISDPTLVGAASDLYSLGATAFYLLTGEELFRGGTLVEICAHHLHTAPRDPRALAPDVPADLAEIVLSCLAKKPTDRPESARALSAMLAGCEVAGEWTEECAERWWREHPAESADAG